jgi:hypothetical protein
MLSAKFDRRRLLLAASSLCLAPTALAQSARDNAEEDLQVRIENKSAPELCAEKDNIELDFVSPRVRAMRVQAIHPSYIGMIGSDRWAPDWTSCDLSHDPKFAADARRLTFWETPEFWLVGYAFPSFWRPNDVPVRVGDRVEHGFHLVQLWMTYRERAEEILVFYPPDGYWRARPRPFEDMRWTAYGSSFLVGPVEVQERPIVALKEVEFDPQTRSFTLRFKRGGEGRVRLASIDQDRIVLDVSYSEAMPDNLPFASLRSMYTTQSMSDAALVAWRTKRGHGWQESPVIGFRGAPATEIWVGRHMPSRHNLSAPDMAFGRFRAGAETSTK